MCGKVRVFSQRTLSLFAAALLLLVAPTAVVAQEPMSPEEFLGYPVGADYHLTTYERAMEWFDHLAAHSEGRMEIREMGMTGMGRTQRYIVISSKENLGRLSEYRETARRLSLGRDLTPTEAQTLAREGKAIVWIDVGLHSTEL